MVQPIFFKSLFVAGILLAASHVTALDATATGYVFAVEDKQYIEINLEIAGLSLAYVSIDSHTMQAAVEVLILIKSGDKVVNFEKYRLNGPGVTFPTNLLDLKRFYIAPGNYTIEIDLQDANKADNFRKINLQKTVGAYDRPGLSDIQLLRNFKRDTVGNGLFHKNGYFMEPLPFAFYDRESTKLAFYVETYHSNQIAGIPHYQLRYLIEADRGNGKRELISTGNRIRTLNGKDAVQVKMDIAGLASGNYMLTVEMRRPDNELIASKSVDFQRINPLLDLQLDSLNEGMLAREFVSMLDSSVLRYSLKAVSIVSTSDQTESIAIMLKRGTVKEMQFFLFRHFARENPNNPRQAYTRFMEKATFVDKRFYSGYRHGFETDRGRAYMRFDKPDDIVHVEDDPAAPPYEIWIYYNFPKTAQQNVKFLFYNPSLAGEDYILLHSTARGETKNPQWERILYARNAYDQDEGDNYNDATGVQRNLGRNARVYFEDF